MVNNFKVGNNVPRKVRHVCHKDGEKHECCLVELYKEYIDFIKIENCNMHSHVDKYTCVTHVDV